jgi:hypothetical protein
VVVTGGNLCIALFFILDITMRTGMISIDMDSAILVLSFHLF